MRLQPAKLAQGFCRQCQPLRNPLFAPSKSSSSTSTRHRSLHIQATPSSTNPSADALDQLTSTTGNLAPPAASTDPTSPTPDARFEVLGTPASLLSVSLSASQNLFTRRGTLVGVSGNPENAISSLSPLSPLRRALLGIPFLYQRVASITPLNLLIATRAPHTSFSVVHLDGRTDWIVAQRNGLVAWTGHTLSVRPSANLKMSLAHWGNTVVSGRGLVALTGSGQIYQLTLKAGEQYVAHPSNVLAYTITPTLPTPYRFKSSTLRLQLPSLTTLLPNLQFFRTMQTTTTWRTLANVIFTLRTWTRSTLFGDRLFLSFKGPTTLLLQSRGSRLRDVLTPHDISEIADAPAGVLHSAPSSSTRTAAAAAGGDHGAGGGGGTKGDGRETTTTKGHVDVVVPPPQQKMSVRYATVDRGGRVAFETAAAGA